MYTTRPPASMQQRPLTQVPDRVKFVVALPMGGTGKVLKQPLRERFAAV